MGVPPIAETRRTLLDAWRSWDDQPSNPSHVTALERAYDAHGSHFGLRATSFRDICAAFRRASFTREQAIAAVEAAVGTRA